MGARRGCVPLEAAVRVERANDDALVAIEDAGAEIFGASSFAFQLGELVEHFLFGEVEGADESLIELVKRVAVGGEKLGQRFFAGGEFFGEGFGQRGLFDLGAHFLVAGEKIFERQCVFGEQARDGRFDEREAIARENGGHAIDEALEDDFGLRHVGDFSGAADVGSGRQQNILHDRAEKNVGREGFQGLYRWRR